MAPRSIDPGLKHPANAETELLLCCARLVLEPGGRERILRLLESGVDWARVLAMAGENGLLPLLYRHLNALPAGALPKDVLVELWGRHEATSRRNHARVIELLQILQLFDANGIPAIPYKGPALAVSVYGDVALREFGDLDILLRRADVLRAKALLLARDYQPAYPLEPAVEAAFLRSRAQYHLVVVHERRGMVELHWKTDPDFPVERIDDERWWAKLESVPLGEGWVRCFSNEEQLMVLCLHGSKHRWEGLGWLVDVAELIRQQPRMDWRWILDKSASLGCERRLMLGLYLASRLLGAPLPEEVRSRIAARNELGPLASKILATLFTPGAEALRPLEALRFNLSLYERTRQRIGHCLNVILSPSLIEWSRWPLPRSLFVLYPPLRLMRLTGKHMLRLLRKG